MPTRRFVWDCFFTEEAFTPSPSRKRERSELSRIERHPFTAFGDVFAGRAGKMTMHWLKRIETTHLTEKLWGTLFHHLIIWVEVI
jgi:hypothetical protein